MGTVGYTLMDRLIRLRVWTNYFQLTDLLAEVGFTVIAWILGLRSRDSPNFAIVRIFQIVSGTEVSLDVFSLCQSSLGQCSLCLIS